MSQYPREPRPSPPSWPVIFLMVLVVVVGYNWFENWLRGPLHRDAVPRQITARGALADDEKATIEVFKKCSPSVVHITTSDLRRSPFSLRVTEVPQGTGSGFVWNKDGYVVTNFHVVKDGKAFRVALSDNSIWEAELVGTAPDRDLAVLRIKPPADRLEPIELGDSTNLQVGQKVFAIGNPFGLDQTLTSGIISGLGREIESVTGRPIQGVIQTDAAINPGNSGGPLLDSAGLLIGVNTAIASPSGASTGVGFAVPAETVNRVVPQLIKTGKTERVGMGIHIADDNIAVRLGIEGVLIVDVRQGMAADKAGLQPTVMDESTGDVTLGDIIIGVDDAKISNSNDLFLALEKHKPGDVVQVKILRKKQELTVPVTLQSL